MGSVLIASLAGALTTAVLNDPAVPDAVKAQAGTLLSSGVPFISDTQLQTSLTQAGVPAEATATVMNHYADARLVALQTAMAFVALFALIGLFLTRHELQKNHLAR